MKALREEGVEILGILGLFDYGFDLAVENFKKENIKLHTLSDYHHLINEAEKSNFIKPEDITLLNFWRICPNEWQPN